MPLHIYNSRDRHYKSIYGAIAVNQTVKLRLLLPENFGGLDITEAKFVILNDATVKTEEYHLSRTDEHYSGSVYWELDYTPTDVGLFWYHFTFIAGGYTHNIFKGQYSNGYVDGEDDSWQLTVYSGEQEVASQWKGGIMYQIFPDRFFSSGTQKIIPMEAKLVRWRSMPQYTADPETGLWNNDYLGGDLKGIEEKLPYLKDLGVDIIYLNPIFEAHSNHRYNTANYMAIDPLLGKEDDFISLCAAAHKLGIKIILDGVFSHTGDDSIYFNKYDHYSSVGAYQSKESPYYSWYKFENWPDSYKSWWGVPILPEIIEEEPSYLEFITGEGGVIEKWLLLGADGWRLDVADELPDEFIAAIKERIKAVKPEALLLGEVWEDASNKTSYGVRRKYLLGSELDSVMNYPFRNAIIDFVARDNAENFFEQILTITENYPKQIVDSLMNPLGTHDTERILTLLAGYNCENMPREAQAKLKLDESEREHALALLKVATVLQYTLPGFPSIYYGDEVGMEGGRDPFNRQGLPWYDINEDLLAFYKELGEVRQHKSYVFRDADFVPISAADGVVCFERRNTDEYGKSYSIIVLVNRGDDAINYTLPSTITDATAILQSDGVLVDGDLVRLPACGYVLLENVPVILKNYRRGSKI